MECLKSAPGALVSKTQYINKAKQAQEVLKRLQYYKQKNLLKPSSKHGQTEKEQQKKKNTLGIFNLYTYNIVIIKKNIQSQPSHRTKPDYLHKKDHKK
jgi:hypothetical protein